MMACCYIEDYFDRVSFSQLVDRMKSYTINYNISAPAEYDYYRELLIYQRCGDFARQFQILTFSLLATDLDEYEQLMGSQVIGNIDRSWAKELSRAVDPKPLADLEILSIDEDCPERQNDPQYKESVRKSSGADDCVERIVLLELDGVLFYKGFTLVEVDGRWQIYMLNALLLGESANGNALPVESAEEYHDLIQ